MLDRKPSKSLRQNHSQDNDDKNYLNSDDPRVRVLQHDLVFANGLPSDISSKETLIKDIYFGRYGKVIKSILNPPYPYKKGINYQVYATYENEIDASLAIVALDGLSLGDRPLKVSYGTTKYCSYFLKGRECTNNDCFYLHQIQKQRQVLSGDNRTIFKDQNHRAIKMVLENLEEIVQRILDSKIQHLQEGFPSLTQTMDFLIDNQFLDQGLYYSTIGKVKKQRLVEQEKQQNSLKASQNDLKSSQKSKQDNLTIDEPPKLIKSNSFSTMASPNKPEASSTEFDDLEKRVYQIENNLKTKANDSCIPKDLDQEVRTAKSDDQNKKSYQKSLDFEERTEDNISQKIIKEILKKKGVRSKFDFVKFDVRNSQVADEIKKVKNIIQRFLITYQ